MTGMTVKSMVSFLGRLGFDGEDYAIGEGLHSENRWCVTQEGEIWIVFWSERGVRFDALTFNSENVACTHLFGLLAQKFTLRTARTW